MIIPCMQRVIVLQAVPTRYCENLFPKKYGDIIDFIHVYGEEMEKFGDAIEWLPEEEARLQFSDFRGNKDVV